MKKIKEPIIIVIIIVIVVSSLLLISRIFIPKWINKNEGSITYIMRGLYSEKKNSMDVMFMGNSQIYSGVNPMELWNDYGVSSYVYASPGQRSSTTYYMLKEALEYQHPKVIVMNVENLFYKTTGAKTAARKVFDNMRWDKVKVEAIMDKSYQNTPGDVISYMFPLLWYHFRYKELKLEDFNLSLAKIHHPYKGYSLHSEINPKVKDLDYMEVTDDKAEFNPKGQEYLEKIIDICNKENIKIVLVQVPAGDFWNYPMHKTMSEYAKQKNLTFIDMNLMLDELKFDWNTDTYDKGTHLNIYGSDKVTSFLGEYLTKNYALVNHKFDKNYSDWNTQYKDYLKGREEDINRTNKGIIKSSSNSFYNFNERGKNIHEKHRRNKVQYREKK
ncbi:MAG: hypothetical protein RSB41_00255 [Bacilli bacterium]